MASGQDVFQDYQEVADKILSSDRTQIKELNSSLKKAEESFIVPLEVLLYAAEEYCRTTSNKDARSQMQKFVERTNSALKKADKQFLYKQKLERENR